MDVPDMEPRVMDFLLSILIPVISISLLLVFFFLGYRSNPMDFTAAGGVQQDDLGFIVFFVGPLLTAMVLEIIGLVFGASRPLFFAILLLIAGFVGTWIFTSGQDGYQVSVYFICYCPVAVVNLLLSAVIGKKASDREQEEFCDWYDDVREDLGITNTPGGERYSSVVYGNDAAIQKACEVYGFKIYISYDIMEEKTRSEYMKVGEEDIVTMDGWYEVDRTYNRDIYDHVNIKYNEVVSKHERFKYSSQATLRAAQISEKAEGRIVRVSCEGSFDFLVAFFFNGNLIDPMCL